MPPTVTPEPQLMANNGTRQTSRRTKNAQVASPIAKSTALVRTAATESKAGADLAPIFKEDLSSIRSLVTCSICDQLLYEPFTIQCGHTYCYSCLCSWFVPNKKKKTCPECRTIIKQMPAPSFMIKQMVEILVKRVELMPPDESVEQHTTKRTEEIAAVECDRNSQQGLFKGLFPARRLEPILDEADGVHRCPHCNVEYLGGPACMNCGAEIDHDGYDFSGDDLDDLEAVEDDFQEELEAEFGDIDGAHEMMENARRLYYDHALHHHHLHHHHHFVGGARHNPSTPSIASNSEDSRGDEHSESDSEDDGSMQDFIVNDDSPESRHEATPRDLGPNSRVRVEITPLDRHPHHLINISDDDSEDEGPVVRNRGRRVHRSRSNAFRPQIIHITDDEDDVSDGGEAAHVAQRLMHDGWSPLHESENEEHYGRDTTDLSDHTNEVTNNTNDESDTETMVGNDDDRGRRPFSWHRATRPSYRIVELEGTSDQDDNESEAGMSSNMDQDGDTDMSLSPEAHTYRGDYGNYPESESSRGSQAETDEYEGPYDREIYDPEAGTEINLGNGHDMHDIEDASDDWPLQPVRRRIRPSRQEREHNYDPRISQIFAHHQSIRVGSEGSRATSTGLDELEPAAEESPESEIIESHRSYFRPRGAGHSSSRRNVAYRIVPLRQSFSRRRARSPSVTRVISSSNRPARVERQYHHERSGPRVSAYWP